MTTQFNINATVKFHQLSDLEVLVLVTSADKNANSPLEVHGVAKYGRDHKDAPADKLLSIEWFEDNWMDAEARFNELVTESQSKKKLIAGVGFNDLIGSSKTPAYFRWKHMLHRCYSDKVHLNHPTYKGCTVHNGWLTFSAFQQWSDKVDALFGPNEWQLDKDLLDANNKVYSEINCLPVSSQLNTFVLSRDADRGQYPQGVCRHKATGKLAAQIAINGTPTTIGYFDCPLEAHNEYKKVKRSEFVRLFTEEFNMLEEHKLIPNGMSARGLMEHIMETRWPIDQM